jgi:hypothetical protein
MRICRRHRAPTGAAVTVRASTQWVERATPTPPKDQTANQLQDGLYAGLTDASIMKWALNRPQVPYKWFQVHNKAAGSRWRP